MSWLMRLLRAKPRLSPEQNRALDAWRMLQAPDPGQPLQTARFVVADVETSGLNVIKDKLISIGAVAISAALIRFEHSFEVVLRQDAPSDHGNILLHGIGGMRQVEGREPAEGLIDFLRFAGKSPLIGFHADFDRIVITRALRKVLGIDFPNAWLDVAVLIPSLFAERAPDAYTLDDWMQVFAIDNYARHNAVADALATAQLFQIVLAGSAQQRLKTCADLIRLEKNQRWLDAR